LATTVYTTEDIVLQDGSEITLKRLNIKNQRLFMKRFTNLEVTETDDEATDQMIELAQICLRGVLKNTKFEEKAEDNDWLEEALDEPTIYKIIEVCAGIKLNDPNLLAAAAAAMTASEAAGTN
jgi:hypothetical protein